MSSAAERQEVGWPEPASVVARREWMRSKRAFSRSSWSSAEVGAACPGAVMVPPSSTQIQKRVAISASAGRTISHSTETSAPRCDFFCDFLRREKRRELCERRKAPDILFYAAKLDFVDREKRILWVAFSRKMADVRGGDFRAR